MDDVIRIRVDAAWAVEDALDFAAKEGAPVPAGADRVRFAALAVWRELAPFRLEEYGYLAENEAPTKGVYLGFPEGDLFTASEEIPEAVVLRMVEEQAGCPALISPVYIYVVLTDKVPAATARRFLDVLYSHVERPFVGCFRENGTLTVQGWGTPPDRVGAERMRRALARAVVEADRHLSRERIEEHIARRARRQNGHSYAALPHRFTTYFIEFVQRQDRDDFVEWTRNLCAKVLGEAPPWPRDGFLDLSRPARPAVAPAAGTAAPVVPLAGPRNFDNGAAWNAVLPATPASEAHRQAALAYWRHVEKALAES